MPKRILRLAFLLVVLMGLYFVGPEPAPPAWSSDRIGVPVEPQALEEFIARNESRHKLKPDNEARIIWSDSTRKRTPYAVVYLHGFSASQKEGDPVHRQFAREFGCNLYLARLADHGIDTVDAMVNFTADRWWRSAREALAIGSAIGDEVIIMSTSTGGTMALALASDFPDDVFALINMSPNVAINNGAAFLLNDPWGLQIARAVSRGKCRQWDAPPERTPFWYSKYRLEATVQLEEMLETKMTRRTFERITQPCLTLYYYKNEKEQDPEVRVDAMLEMMAQLGTSFDEKRSVAIPDAGAHVLGCSLVSKDVAGVYAEIQKFAEEVLHMEPAGYY